MSPPHKFVLYPHFRHNCQLIGGVMTPPYEQQVTEDKLWHFLMMFYWR